jgi:acetyl-CoA C-acetyltransferase
MFVSSVLMSEAKVKELGLKPIAKILSYADAEVAPVDFCIAPALSGQIALKRANLTID